MNQPEEPPAAAEGIHLEAQASGDATVYQAARDQHLHFRDGVRTAQRAEGPGSRDECPYPGLAAFGPAQARWFFGRDELTADLAGRLNDCLAEGGPLMVVAPSGAGKSSLLQAGLLPAITRGALPRGSPALAAYRVHPHRPSDAGSCRGSRQSEVDPSVRRGRQRRMVTSRRDAPPRLRAQAEAERPPRRGR